MRLTSTSPRRGFTLIEVLVAAGLSMLIMAVVTAAFQKGMDTLSQLKSVGEMQQRLRNFELAMRADLEADHFDGRGSGKVSDQRLDLLLNNSATLTNDTTPWRPPTRGFFRIVNNDQPGALQETIEGTDSDGNISTRAVDHMLHMTVRRNATRGDRLFTTSMAATLGQTAPVGGVAGWTGLSQVSLGQMTTTPNTVSSEWAEVIYFLDIVQGHEAGKTPGGTPLYGMYRKVRVLPGVDSASSLSWYSMASSDPSPNQGLSHAPYRPDVSPNPAGRMVNNPSTIRDPRNRLGGITSSRVRGTTDLASGPTQVDVITREEDSNGNPTGADLLLTDVISFEVKADWDGGATPFNSGPSTYEFPFNILPNIAGSRNNALTNRRIYDTWFDTADNSWLNAPQGQPNNNTTVVPQPIRLRAIQIKVRVWDRKNNMARQVTIVESL